MVRGKGGVGMALVLGGECVTQSIDPLRAKAVIAVIRVAIVIKLNLIRGKESPFMGEFLLLCPLPHIHKSNSCSLAAKGPPAAVI